MTRDTKFFSNSITYGEMQEVLFENSKLKAFPIVENEGKPWTGKNELSGIV